MVKLIAESSIHSEKSPLSSSIGMVTLQKPVVAFVPAISKLSVFSGWSKAKFVTVEFVETETV